MKTVTVMSLALLATTSADVPVMPDEYSLLCEGEQATGFNWRSKNWVKTNFKTSRYLVTNKPENECIFAPVIDRELQGEDKFFSRDACLNIREFGEDYNPRLSEKCTEVYVKKDKVWRRQFSCDGLFSDIWGNFNGGFRRISDSTVHDDVDKKDSMVLEVGKCSHIL